VEPPRAVSSERPRGLSAELALLRRDLNTTSRRKYGLILNASERGIAAMGMPLHSGGRPVAISVSVPSVRFSPAQLREMLLAVRCCGCHRRRTWERVAPVGQVAN
jgi:DNA-binding IclR family transcriptional regulator